MSPLGTRFAGNYERKKTDVVERPKAFRHVGLLINEPPGHPGCSLYSHPKTFLKTRLPPPASYEAENDAFCYYNYRGPGGECERGGLYNHPCYDVTEVAVRFVSMICRVARHLSVWR